MTHFLMSYIKRKCVGKKKKKTFLTLFGIEWCSVELNDEIVVKILLMVTGKSYSCSRMFQHWVTVMGANLREPHHWYLNVVLGVQLRLCNNTVFFIIVLMLVCPFITSCSEFACNISYSYMYWVKKCITVFWVHINCDIM